jgi:structural maintenance of chromosome 1
MATAVQPTKWIKVDVLLVTCVRFQGDIEKVAQKSPQELAEFFELVSGSDAFKAEFEELEGKVAGCQEAIGVLVAKKKALEKRKKILAEAKEEAERYKELTATLVRIFCRSALGKPARFQRRNLSCI